jgi:hypothetical protein
LPHENTNPITKSNTDSYYKYYNEHTYNIIKNIYKDERVLFNELFNGYSNNILNKFEKKTKIEHFSSEYNVYFDTNNNVIFVSISFIVCVVCLYIFVNILNYFIK